MTNSDHPYGDRITNSYLSSAWDEPYETTIFIGHMVEEPTHHTRKLKFNKEMDGGWRELGFSLLE